MCPMKNPVYDKFPFYASAATQVVAARLSAELFERMEMVRRDTNKTRTDLIAEALERFLQEQTN